MPVRTTTVVALGLVVLAVVGVGTIFGESVAALIVPAPAVDTGTASPAGSAARVTAGTSPPAAAPGIPGRDAGHVENAGPRPDGSS